jgi:hypothetical protein
MANSNRYCFDCSHAETEDTSKGLRELNEIQGVVSMEDRVERLENNIGELLNIYYRLEDKINGHKGTAF